MVRITKPAFAIAAHAGNYIDEIVSFLSQRVLHPWRNLREHLAQEDAFLFERVQALRERFRTDPFEGPFELAKAFDTGGQIADNK